MSSWCNIATTLYKSCHTYDKPRLRQNPQINVRVVYISTTLTLKTHRFVGSNGKTTNMIMNAVKIRTRANFQHVTDRDKFFVNRLSKTHAGKMTSKFETPSGFDKNKATTSKFEVHICSTCFADESEMRYQESAPIKNEATLSKLVHHAYILDPFFADEKERR